MTEFSCGFYFADKGKEVALIKKARPDWQKDRFNGVGGHIESGETPLECMVREFHEETGVKTNPQDWTHRVTLRGNDFVTYFFAAFTGCDLATFRNDTDEPVQWFMADELPRQSLPNLRWLIPMCQNEFIREGLRFPITIYEENVPPAVGLTFDEYQEKAASTAIYPAEAAVLYPILGHSGEAAELTEKVMHGMFPDGAPQAWDDVSLFMRSLHNTLQSFVLAGKSCEATKKFIRDQTDKLPDGVLEEIKRRVEAIPADSRPGIIKERGDLAWYGSAIDRDLGVKTSNVAQANLDKLASRKARGVLSGSGDSR